MPGIKLIYVSKRSPIQVDCLQVPGSPKNDQAEANLIQAAQKITFLAPCKTAIK